MEVENQAELLNACSLATCAMSGPETQAGYARTWHVSGDAARRSKISEYKVAFAMSTVLQTGWGLRCIS